MKNRKSILLRLGALLVTVLTLTSCAVTLPPQPADTTPSTTPEPNAPDTSQTLPSDTQIKPQTDYEASAKANLASLPDVDMNGNGFVILTTRPELIVPNVDESEEEGRIADMEAIKRNRLVEDKYNVKLLSVVVAEDQILSRVKESLSTGLHLADLIELPSHLLGNMASLGYTVNMNTLPFTDYSQPYFDQTAIDQCSAGYSTYAVAGNANKYASQSYCLYFRTDLLQNVTPSELYQTAWSNQWDWDTFLSCVSHRTGTDKALAIPENTNLARVVLGSGDSHLLDTAYGTLPQASAEDFADVQAAADLTKTLTQTAYLGASVEDFKSGVAPFYLGTLEQHTDFADLSASWGILPLPKLSQWKTQYATTGAYQTVFTAIKTMHSTERTGLILQALNAASVGQLTAATVKEILMQSAQSASAANILDLFAENQSYDFGYMMSGGYDFVRKASVDAYEGAVLGKNTFEKLYKNQESNLTKQSKKKFVWN